MILRHINKADCDALLIEHATLERFLGLEMDWFANEAEDVLGIIGMSCTAQSWRLAVLTRRWDGSFQLGDLRWNALYSYAASRAELLRHMTRLASFVHGQEALSGQLFRCGE